MIGFECVNRSHKALFYLGSRLNRSHTTTTRNLLCCRNGAPPLQKRELHSRITYRLPHFINLHPKTRSETAYATSSPSTPTSREAPPFSNLQGLSNAMGVPLPSRFHHCSMHHHRSESSAFNREPPRICRKRI